MKPHLASATMIALTLLSVAAGSVAAQQQPEDDAVSLGIATSQTDAPVGLRGYLASAGSFLYATAKVENLSDRPISGVTLGVLVADPQGQRTATLLRSSVKVSLPPGGKQDVAVRLLPPDQLEALQQSVSETPVVTLGVLAVEWADGSSWSFTLADDATDFSRAGSVAGR